MADNPPEIDVLPVNGCRDSVNDHPHNHENTMKRNPFVTFGLIIACVISMSMPAESAVKYAEIRENTPSAAEGEAPYSREPSSSGPGNH